MPAEELRSLLPALGNQHYFNYGGQGQKASGCSAFQEQAKHKHQRFYQRNPLRPDSEPSQEKANNGSLSPTQNVQRVTNGTSPLRRLLDGLQTSFRSGKGDG